MKWRKVTAQFVTCCAIIAAIWFLGGSGGVRVSAQEGGASAASSALRALEGLSLRAEDMRESSEETKKTWEALRKASGDGDAIAIGQKAAEFLKVPDFTEPYQKTFATLLQRIIAERDLRERELVDATNRLASVRTNLAAMDASLKSTDNQLLEIFKGVGKGILGGFIPVPGGRKEIHGSDLLENMRREQLEKRKQLEADERKALADIQGVVTEAAQRRSKLRAAVISHLRALEKYHHYQAQEAFANGYLAILGEDIEVGEIAQDARQVIKLQVSVRTVVNDALSDARKKSTNGLLWQALESAREAEETLAARVADRLAQDMIKAEMTLFKSSLSRQIAEAKERIKVIETFLSGSDGKKALMEWERFQKEFPDYPDRIAVEQRIGDAIFSSKVSKFEQILDVSPAQATEALKQLLTETFDEYTKRLLQARLQKTVNDHVEKEVVSVTTEITTVFRLMGRDVQTVEKILPTGSLIELNEKEVKVASHDNVLAARSLLTGNATRLQTLGKLPLEDVPRSKINGLLATCTKASTVLAAVPISSQSIQTGYAGLFWSLVFATAFLGIACLGLFWRLRKTTSQVLVRHASV